MIVCSKIDCSEEIDFCFVHNSGELLPTIVNLISNQMLKKAVQTFQNQSSDNKLETMVKAHKPSVAAYIRVCDEISHLLMKNYSNIKTQPHLCFKLRQ